MLKHDIKDSSAKFNSLLVSGLLTSIVFCLNPPWFIWNYSYILASISVLILFFVCFNRIVKWFGFYFRFIIIYALLVLFFVVYGSFGEFRFSSVITLLTFFLLFFITKAEKIWTLKYVTKILSIIVLISLSGWLLNKYVFSLPIFGYLAYGVGKGDAGDVLLNYIIFVDYQSDAVSRFYSVFDEPGVLGTLSAFVLLGNKYDFKNKSNVIILLGGLFTFSLAFIIISIIGILVLNVKKSSTIIKALLIAAVIIPIVFFVLKDDQTFNSVVVDRLINIGENGIDSRTSYGLNSFFNGFVSSPDFYLGMGTDFFKYNPTLLSGQGYKIFVIEYGIIGVVLLFVLYRSFIGKNYFLGYSCLIIFFISFLQRPFLFTPWQLIMFSICLSNLIYLEQKLKPYKNERLPN